MTLTVFSPLVALCGVAGLAIALYVLQRLRVRHRDLEVVTTLFWREAAQERRVRVLMKQFRHPWVFALLLAVASLIWLLIGGPRVEGPAGTRHVILIDGSTSMQLRGRAAEAMDAAHHIAAGLPEGKREVRLVADGAVTILAPDEPLSLMSRRVESRAAVAAPPGFDAAVQAIAASLDERDEQVHVHLIGNAPVRSDVAGQLPESMHLHRHAIAPDADVNPSVAAIGMAEAESGNWRAVDVFATIDGLDADGNPFEPIVTVDGNSTGLVRTSLGSDQFAWRDVPANGGLFTITIALSTPSNDPLDDLASIALPDRPVIRAFADAGVPQPIIDALRADPAVTLAAGAADAEVVFSRDDDADFQLIDEVSDHPAFAVTHVGERQDAMAQIIDSLAIDQIDAIALATQMERELRLDIEPGDRRQVRVWNALFAETFDFRSSRAMPMFISRAVRWLADRPEIVPWAAAGELLPSAGEVAQRPSAAGEFHAIDGSAMHVSLHAPDVSVAQSADDDSSPGTGLVDIWTLLALALLALVVVEWVLYQRGRIP